MIEEEENRGDISEGIEAWIYAWLSGCDRRGTPNGIMGQNGE
jgi:hypothetical protein